MIKINDKDVCQKCGAYWQAKGYCCNGHLNKEKMCNKIIGDEDERMFPFKFVIEGDSGNCSINKAEERLLIQEIEDLFNRRAINNVKVIANC